MPGPFGRSTITAAIGICVLITFWLNLGRLQTTSLGSKLGSIALHPSTSTATTKDGHLPAYTAQYFDQVFSPEDAPYYDFPAIREHCDRTEWRPELEDVYLQCGGMFAGKSTETPKCPVQACFGSSGCRKYVPRTHLDAVWIKQILIPVT